MAATLGHVLVPVGLPFDVCPGTPVADDEVDLSTTIGSDLTGAVGEPLAVHCTLNVAFLFLSFFLFATCAWSCQRCQLKLRDFLCRFFLSLFFFMLLAC